MAAHEKQWVRQFNRGDREALRGIYERYRDDLFGFVLSMLPDGHAAEDVVHDVFVRFAGQSGRFVLTGSLKGYLLTSAANRVRDLRRLKCRQEVPYDRAGAAAEESRSPETLLILTEDARQVRSALLKLPDEQREAVLLHLQFGLTFREIARGRGVSINTIQSRYRYGLEKASNLLKEGGDL